MTNEVRYVGKTVSKLNVRLSKHKHRRNKNNSHKNNWLRLLERKGLLSKLRIIAIEKCEESLLTERERYWIQYFKDKGCDLTNVTSGGEVGSHGYKHSEKAKQKIAQVARQHKGRKLTSVHKKNISKSLIGNTRRLGKPCTEAQKQKISKARRGKSAWNKKKVMQMTLDGEMIQIWESVDKAQKDLGIRNISCAARNKKYRKQAGGFMWRYVDDQV